MAWLFRRRRRGRHAGVPRFVSVTVAEAPRVLPGVVAVQGQDEPVVAAEPSARVRLVFGDGSQVLIDGADPRAAAFTAIADELSR